MNTFAKNLLLLSTLLTTVLGSTESWGINGFDDGQEEDDSELLRKAREQANSVGNDLSISTDSITVKATRGAQFTAKITQKEILFTDALIKAEDERTKSADVKIVSNLNSATIKLETAYGGLVKATAGGGMDPLQRIGYTVTFRNHKFIPTSAKTPLIIQVDSHQDTTETMDFAITLQEFLTAMTGEYKDILTLTLSGK